MPVKLLPLSVSLLLSTAAVACDLCGTTLITHVGEPRPGFVFGASEQFTRMTTLQRDGHEIANDARQKLNSSITQLFLGYQASERFGVQVNVPLIHRRFRRAAENGIESGRVSGLGDVSLLASWLALDQHAGDFAIHVTLNVGVKFPTGDSDRLREEAEHEHSHEHEADAHEEEIHEGVHGHDLTLGTGSLDDLLGASVQAHWRRIFFAGEVQYMLRGDGDHSYDFADDFRWSAGPGVILLDSKYGSLAAQFICSGETKGEDEFQGQRLDHTAHTQVFLGPKLRGTWRERLSAEVELALPVLRENTGVHVQPDYRLRATISWAF